MKSRNTMSTAVLTKSIGEEYATLVGEEYVTLVGEKSETLVGEESSRKTSA